MIIKKSKIFTLGIGFLFLLNLLIISGSTALTNDDDLISTNVWNVTNWNETETLNFFPIANITAEKDSILSYNVTKENLDNYTHPNEGDFSLGNLSLNTDNPSIGSNLGFSVWPWIPGLVANTNWTRHVQDAVSASQGKYLLGDISIKGVNDSKPYKINDFNRQAIEFVYKQDKPGNQNTTLIYDQETGVLLYGFTEIFIDKMYFLELELISSSLISSSNFQELGGVNFPVINLVSIFGFISVVIFRLNNKKKE
ncbi:MAG: hypothetical protein ACW967_06630 [Candidatus Hodarchaeales archaeon]|jgi:hypothetical protein